MKQAILAALTTAKETSVPEHLRTGLTAAAGKGKELAAAAPAVAGHAGRWTSSNPGTAAGLVAVTVGLGLVAAPMAAAGPAMTLGGFGSGGPVAGSFAVAAQAGAGNVAAHGAFATFQSAAMGGYGVPIVSAAVQGVGATMAGTAGGAWLWMRSKV